MSKDRVKGRQAARFFGDNKATLFLVEGLKTEDLDIKGACIEELRRCKPDDLEAIIPQLLMTLESAKDSFSYSTREEFSISEICKSELTYLIADIIKQEKIKREDMNGDREEKTIQNVIARAKQWLTQREATLKSTDKK